MLEEPIKTIIWNCLNRYDFTDAIFLAERLRAEVDSEETLFLLATCYYRAGKRAQVYSILCTRKLLLPKMRYLFAKCCVELGRIIEAERALTGGDAEKYNTVKDVVNEFEDESPYVLQLLGRIYYRLEQSDEGAKYFKWSLQLNPLLWSSFQELCFYGEELNEDMLFSSAAIEQFTNSFRQCGGGENANKISTEIRCSGVCRVVMPGTNSSYVTPAAPYQMAANRLLSGISQLLTPDHHHQSVDKSSPFGVSFGIMPLDTNSPIDTFCLSPSTAVNNTTNTNTNSNNNNNNNNSKLRSRAALANTNDQKLLNRRKTTIRQTTAAHTGTPLPSSGHTISKPVVVLSQLDNTEKSTVGVPAKSPVRRSSRIINNYSVKENNKISSHRHFMTPKPQSTRLKSPKKMRTIRSKLNEINENSTTTLLLSCENSDDTTMANSFEDKKLSTIIRTPKLEKDDPPKEETILPRLLLVIRDIARAYYHLSRYNCNEAIDCLLSLPNNHRMTALVLTLIGKCYVELHEYQESIEYFKMVEKLEPYQVNGLEMYSTALWHLHQESELANLAHSAMKHDRLNPATWCIAGNCMSLQKEHEVAIKFFKRAIQLNPNFVYGYTLLGHEYVVIDDLEKALSCFRTAIRVQPRHYNAWFGMGSIYSKQEKYSLAEFQFQKALNIHPSSAVIMCHVGVVQSALQKPFQALEMFNRALSTDPKSGLCKFHRASLYFNLSDFDGALNELHELMELTPKESLVYYLSGKVHKKLGNDHLALMCFSWATDLDPKGTNTQVKEATPTSSTTATNDLVGNVYNNALDRNIIAETRPTRQEVNFDGI